MDADRIAAYADSVLGIVQAEGDLDEVTDELFRFARAIEGSDDLWRALGDAQLPAATRQQVVQDLLDGKASGLTVAVLGMIVGAGRAKDLPAIVDLVVERAAQERQKEVAEIRSAVDLTDDQRQRLEAALQSATGKNVEVKVVVDPTVLGGVVATIGDTVIDGSVRHRLDQLREAF
jgi:F-type H+-transporting ATPase subunit delta